VVWAATGLISGVILAAGTSSRLGRPKQLLELGGQPALQHAIDRAASGGLDEIVVVLGHEAPLVRSAIRLPSFARVVINADYSSGQASSLRAGLAAVDDRSEAAAVLLGDQPGVEPSAVTAVLGAWRDGQASVARAVYRGEPGHPVVIGRAAFDAFAGAAGDDGGRTALEGLNVLQVEIGTAPPPDIDTWEQYEAVRRAF
jgi:molybdenum cofactor cytidylyltransferase